MQDVLFLYIMIVCYLSDAYLEYYNLMLDTNDYLYIDVYNNLKTLLWCNNLVRLQVVIPSCRP